MSEYTQPNPIDFAAHLVSRDASTSYSGKLHQISVRLQTHNFLHLQAMAETSGLTRSDIVNHVLEAGIYAIRGQLSEEGTKKLDTAISRVASELFEDLEWPEAKQ